MLHNIIPGSIKFAALCSLMAVSLHDTQANSAPSSQKYTFRLSVNNHLGYSQDAATDVAFSVMSGLGALSDKHDLNSHVAYRLGLGYMTFMISLLNHEIAGHGFKGAEFGGNVESFDIGLFSGSACVKMPPPTHVQKDALLSLGGNEVNYLLSQKMADNWVYYHQQIDPIMGFGYMFSAGNQLAYVYTFKDNLPDHDLVSYSRNMELMYGKKSMSLSKIQNIAWLDLLDPFLMASIGSAATGKKMNVPMMRFSESLSVVPFATMLPAPYGILEKKIGVYLLTPYTPIKMSMRFGQQTKTALAPNITQSQQEEWHRYKIIPSNIGVFTGLTHNETIQQHKSCAFDLSVFKFFESDNVSFGFDASVWRQPKLDVTDSYRAPLQGGWMVMLNTFIKLTDHMSVVIKVGYKTKGFTPGTFIEQTPIISLGFEWRI